MTMRELSENLQYFFKLQKKKQEKKKSFRPLTFKFHFFLIFSLF
jgi:hypothetical protein